MCRMNLKWFRDSFLTRFGCVSVMWVGSGCGWDQAVGGALKNVKSFSLEEGELKCSRL